MVAQRQSGYVALLTVLIVGAAATAIALVLLSSGADSQRSMLAEQQSKQARALAVACAQEATQQLHDNVAFVGGNTLSLGQGNCTYLVARPTTTTRSISATATAGPVTRKLLASATIGATTVTMSSWKEVSVNGPSTPAFVQVVSATPQTTPASVAATYAAETAGNTNVVIIGWRNITTTISSVVDSAGNTYQLAAPLIRGTSTSQAMYYAKNITGGAPTITVTFSAVSAFPDLRIMEYSGLDAAAPFDVSVSASGSVATANSGIVNTNYPSSLIVSGGTTSGAFSAPGAGYTQRILTPTDANIAEDNSVTVTGSYTATATTTGNWVMQAAAFRAAGQ